VAVAFIAAAAALASGVRAQTWELASAEVCVQPDTAPTCRAVPVALPFFWDREYADHHGSARFSLRFDAATPGSGAAPALYLPRVGNAFAVVLNGREIYRVGEPGTRSHDSVKRPWLIALPPTLLLAQGNELVITIEATAGRAAQLSTVTLGSQAQLEPLFERERFWRVQLTAAMLWTALVLGLMGLAAWWVQREPMFLCYAVAELAWTARLSDMFFVAMPAPWQVWGAGVAASFGISQLAMTQFFLHAVGRWHGAWRRGYWSYTAVWLAIVPVVVLVEWRELWIGWVAVGTLGFVLLALYVGWRGFVERHHWRWIFASLVLMATVTGFADMAESPGSMYMHPTWSRFIWLGYSLALAALVAQRLQRARVAQQRAHEELRRALAEQATQLDEANRRRARGELDLAMEQERQRVMRDMHDVLGGRLSGLLSLAGRQGGAAAAELQSEVRIAIDELREVVSAMAPFDGNLATMLGSLRPQLERRLALVGVALDWSVDDLPVAESFTPAKVQHLRRLLLEAATNVARHSKAQRAELRARLAADAIEVQLKDDGVGFDPAAAARGNGLRNMQWRAQALGAEMRFEHGAGTTLTLRLPNR
jgi:signal transduction histidine kinase